MGAIKFERTQIHFHRGGGCVSSLFSTTTTTAKMSCTCRVVESVIVVVLVVLIQGFLNLPIQMQKFGFLEREKTLLSFFSTLSIMSGRLHSMLKVRWPLVMTNESIVITWNLTNRRQFFMVCTLIDVLKTRVTAFTKKIATPSRHFHLQYCYRL